MKVSRRFVIIGAILAVCVIILIFVGQWVGWQTGFGPQTTEPKQHAKTLWDWMQLLIIPAVLAVGGYLFNIANTRTEQRIVAQRYENDQRIALDKQREDLLQIYLDRMSELLLDRNIRASMPDAEVRNVARARTITLLFQLDARRIGYVFEFLRESGLMFTTPYSDVVSLNEANLRKINFSQANLREVNLSGAFLDNANLSNAHLMRANFSYANLSNAHLNEANLSGAFLHGADLRKADLSGATLRKADLRGAEITQEQLSKVKSLEGATMPDGSIHP